MELSCICCDRKLPNILADRKGVQPNGGLAFSSRGHYGSSVFDPIVGDTLEIVICDECLARAADSGKTFLTTCIQSPIHEAKVWKRDEWDSIHDYLEANGSPGE